MIRHLLFLIMIFCSCNSTKNLDCNNGELVTLKDFTGLDGCKWLLITQDNSKLEPVNLNDYIQQPKDGDVYMIEWEEQPDLASVCMAGTIAKINCAMKK